jgi:hypothetical protein
MISYAHEAVELNFLHARCTHFAETGVNLAFVSLMQGIKPGLTVGLRGQFVSKSVSGAQHRRCSIVLGVSILPVILHVAEHKSCFNISPYICHLFL